jgi:hypothetical protein
MYRHCEGGTTEAIPLFDSEWGIASLPLAMTEGFLEMPLNIPKPSADEQR